MPKSKGKLIVLEGTDGSGKATQAKLLLKALRESGHKVAFLDFPQYGKPSCVMVERYLNGKYGKADAINPYQASLFYAVDRFDASFKLKQWLKEGKMVIANRYVASNLAHQGGKIKNARERKKYFDWNQNLEYNIFGIPKPDLNIILFVPAQLAQKLVDKKGKRRYLGGKKKRDIHERDMSHLLSTQKVYKQLAQLYPKFYKLISCVQNGQIMSRDKISFLVWQELENVFSI